MILVVEGDLEQNTFVVYGLDDDATLLDALEKAQKDGDLS